MTADLFSRSWTTLRVARANAATLVVTLNRPEVMNAISSAMMGELGEAFAAANANGDLHCVVLTGAGKAFCAGADLKERQGLDDATWRSHHGFLEDSIRAIAACPVPLIAAVNGAAVGGGCELTLLADFAYAHPSARFGLPETTRGIIPGAGGTQTLPRAVGLARASELIFTGRIVDAEEALALGIVLALADDPLGRALATARRIEANGPIAVRAAKRALRGTFDFDAAYAAELGPYDETVATDDRREGVRAFVEKRPPKFTGR